MSPGCIDDLFLHGQNCAALSLETDRPTCNRPAPHLGHIACQYTYRGVAKILSEEIEVLRCHTPCLLASLDISCLVDAWDLSNIVVLICTVGRMSDLSSCATAFRPIDSKVKT